MLSIACDEQPTAPEEEPTPAILPLRRLAVTFESSSRRRRASEKRKRDATVGLPAYSRIVFRAGAVVVR
jgi:hypothetical protein